LKSKRGKTRLRKIQTWTYLMRSASNLWFLFSQLYFTNF
jgi:hypothetical protein